MSEPAGDVFLSNHHALPVYSAYSWDTADGQPQSRSAYGHTKFLSSGVATQTLQTETVMFFL